MTQTEKGLRFLHNKKGDVLRFIFKLSSPFWHVLEEKTGGKWGGGGGSMIKICFDEQRKRTKFIFHMRVRISCLCISPQWPSFISIWLLPTGKFRFKKGQDVFKLLTNVSNKMQIPLPKNTVNTVGDDAATIPLSTLVLTKPGQRCIHPRCLCCSRYIFFSYNTYRKLFQYSVNKDLIRRTKKIIKQKTIENVLLPSVKIF